MAMGEGNGPGRGVTAAVCSKGAGHRKGWCGDLGVWRNVLCGGEPGHSGNRHTNNRATATMPVTKGHTPHRGGRVQRLGPQRSKGRYCGRREGPVGTREGSTMTQPTPKTTTPSSTQSQEAGEGSNEELKEQNKVIINSSEHFESDYWKAE